MPTPSGHTRAIPASKVQGTSVYDTAGNKIGAVEDIILDKMSNNIMFAVVGFGGFLGIGEKFHSVPWALLDFDPEKGGYTVTLSKDQLKKAPAYSIDEFTRNDGKIRDESFRYYNVQPYWQ
jgi:sporulation protein YlmC with PRC-barrel domain